MSAIEEIKARTNIIDLISRYTPLKRAGSIYKGLCPFHNERTPSFVVYPNSGTWHCFGACSTGGDVFSFLMRKENLDFREALERLAQETGVSLEEQDQDQERTQKAALFEVNEAAAKYFHDLLLNHAQAAPARDYLERRKMDRETIDSFQIGFALEQWSPLRDYLSSRGFGLDIQLAAGLVKRNEQRESIYDAFRNRVIIPIRDRQGRVIGFGGRVLDNSQPKYLNTAETPLFHKSHVVFAIDRAQNAIRDADQVVIVEGYMDVIAAHQHGYENVVACMGTALTTEQLRQLQRYTQNFVLALDADAAGEAATIRGLNQARQSLTRVSKPVVSPGGRVQMTDRLGASLRIISMPEGMDPDDVIRGDRDLWQDLVGRAQPLVDFFFAVTSRRVDLASAQGKAEAVAELAPLIAEVDNDVERQHYVHQLARLVQVEEFIIESRVRAAARATQAEPPADRRTTDIRNDARSETSADDESAALDGNATGAPTTERRVRSVAQPAIEVEDHLLAMMVREPDALIWMAQRAAELKIDPPQEADLQHAENQEIFGSLKRFITSDERWDIESFQESLAPPLHAKLASLMAYASALPPRTDPELREGMIKDIVHLRLQKLKTESIAVKYLVDEAQRSGEMVTARALGSVYGRIQRELDHLQPLKLRENHRNGERRRNATSARLG
jgi:DNA primase